MTLIHPFPIAVAMKNVQKDIKKWPQVSPARSKSGFGIEAHNSTTKKARFFNDLYITLLNQSINPVP